MLKYSTYAMRIENFISTLAIIAFFFFQSTEARAIENTDTILNKINIPLLVISTDDAVDPPGYRVDHPEGCVGIGLAGNEYVTGRMTVKLMDSLMYDSGEYLSGAYGIRIKQRGNISATWSKKPYKIKLSKKTDLFFRGDDVHKSKEWLLLNCPKLDLNTLVGFKVSELLGMEWTPQCGYVNLVINGDYKGLYVLCESIDRGVGKCNIASTGFIIEDDAYWWNEDVYFKGEMLPYYMGYTFKYPDTDDMSSEHIATIQQYIIEVERRLLNYEDIDEYIDISTFASWLIAQDILGAEDAVGSNKYIYKYDFIQEALTDSKLKMGPLWDFDDIYRREGQWSQQHSGNYRMYFKYLLKYESFIDEYTRKWNSIKGTLYNDIVSFLNELKETRGDALDYCRELDSKRWNRLKYLLLDEEIENIANWFAARIEWIDNQLEIETGVDVVYEHDVATSCCVYTLDGRPVLKNELDCLPAGIYIKDGKKYIVK